MNAVRLRDVVSYVALGVIVAIVLAYFWSLGLRVRPPDDRTNLTMDVPETNGLVAGSNVLLRGVPIGKVTDTRTSLDTATVGFWVDGHYRIPVDTEIRLDNLSALGESYIELAPRRDGGQMLKNGQHISSKSVVQPPSISELATSVVRVLNQLDPGAVGRIINESDAALPDPNVVLPNLSRASTLFNNMINDMHGQGRVLLGNFQTLIRNAEWVNPDLLAIVPNGIDTGIYWQDFFKQLPVLFSRDMPQGMRNLNNLVARIQNLLDTNGGDLKVLGEALQPKLNNIGATLMNFDSGQILDNFLQQVPAEGIITLHVRP